MEMTARRIEYSDSNRVRHGRWQTNFIPGGPKPPKYDGMNEVEKVMAKQECKRERKKITDGLCIKRLKEQNENYDAEEFSGCVYSLAYAQLWTFRSVGLKSITPFPTKRFWCCVSPKRPTYEGSTLFTREVICVKSSDLGQDFV